MAGCFPRRSRLACRTVPLAGWTKPGNQPSQGSLSAAPRPRDRDAGNVLRPRTGSAYPVGAAGRARYRKERRARRRRQHRPRHSVRRRVIGSPRVLGTRLSWFESRRRNPATSGLGRFHPRRPPAPACRPAPPPGPARRPMPAPPRHPNPADATAGGTRPAHTPHPAAPEPGRRHSGRHPNPADAAAGGTGPAQTAHPAAPEPGRRHSGRHPNPPDAGIGRVRRISVTVRCKRPTAGHLCGCQRPGRQRRAFTPRLRDVPRRLLAQPTVA